MINGRIGKWVGGFVLLGFLCFLVISCVRPEPPTTQPSQPVQPEEPLPVTPLADSDLAPAPPAAQPPAAAQPENLYQAELKPLAPAQCGQCHPAIYNALKEAGGKHRFTCQNCHVLFHVADQEEAMPECSRCHTPPPHGNQFTDCLSCHVNPHAPRRVPINERLTGNCSTCHSDPAGELKQNPSAHTEVGCQNCHHDRHGYIPVCLECHNPHFEGQPAETCQECHPPHKPLKISFSQNIQARTCADCHSAVYQTWSTTPSRHGQVNCGRCHTEHGLIPACTKCHPEPHSEVMLAAYPKCLTCHLDAHNPPVKNKP